jgi:16S rRNA (uracil1498-N3)-methyltransferase
MPKFFVKSEQIRDNNIIIKGEDVNHIINVLRMKPKEEINICNSEDGKNYLATIQGYSKDTVECKIVEEIESQTESNVKITIFQGLPKFDKLELIIQKNTEIGVVKIVPVMMKRTIVKLNGKEDKKVERWRKISEIASKQSMRDIIPEVTNIENMEDVKKQAKDFDLFFIAYENEKKTTLKEELKKINEKQEYNIGILIGPEGGIDEKEIEMLSSFENVRIVTLGNRILRTETAGLVMASNIIYELEK